MLESICVTFLWSDKEGTGWYLIELSSFYVLAKQVFHMWLLIVKNKFAKPLSW